MQRHTHLALPLLLLLTIVVPDRAQAQACELNAQSSRPKIGLVLGGGGARGAAHIGVLRRLEELRVPVHSITGTSMGAIVGALYASGMSADEIEAFSESLDWADLFDDKTPRQERSFRRKRDDRLSLFGPKLGVGKDRSLLPRGAITGQKILVLLESTLNQRQHVTDFDDLPIPFRAVAADIALGKPVVLERGNLALAVRASMSIPAAIEPVIIDDRMLVDGGVVNNLPVDVAQDQQGADLVIAVNVGTPLLEQSELTDVIAIAEQLTNLIVAGNTGQQIDRLKDGDILVVPQLGTDIGAADFERMAEAIPIGYQAATVLDEPLAGLGLNPEDYRRYRENLTLCRTPVDPAVRFVRVINRSRFADKVIAERLHVPLGQPLNRDRLELDIEQIYALGFLDRVSYQLVIDNGETGLVIEVMPDERGHDLLEYGIDLVSNADSADISVRLGYLKNDIGDYGGEFRSLLQLGEDPGLLLELYQPLDPDLRWIVLPQLSGLSSEVTRYDTRGNKLDRFKVDTAELSGAFGREFGKHAALFVGASFGVGHVEVDIGDPALPSYHFDSGSFFINAVYDRLDDLYFPTKGGFAALLYSNSNNTLGADSEFEQISFTAAKAFSQKRHTLIGGLRYNTTLDDNAPIQNLFRAGGITRMAGYEDGEIAGQHFGLVYGSYRYEIGRTGFLPAYIGGTLEYGNATDDRDDVFGEGVVNGSLYFGYNSPIGPLYAGFGMAEGGRQNFFLSIGNLFERRRFAR